MSDYAFGPKISGNIAGRDNNIGNVYHGNISEGLSQAELNAALAELSTFVAELARAGLVGADGSITNPSAVVAAVESQSSRFTALGRALAGGAKDAILKVARDGVAALIVALVGRM